MSPDRTESDQPGTRYLAYPWEIRSHHRRKLKNQEEEDKATVRGSRELWDAAPSGKCEHTPVNMSLDPQHHVKIWVRNCMCLKS